MKDKNKLKTFSIRMDEDKMKDAEKLGINTAELFRKALDKELAKQIGKCPTCGWKKT